MGETVLPPLLLELRANASEVRAELGKVKGEVRELDKESAGGLSKTQKGFSTLAGAGKAIAFGLAGAGAAVAAFGIEAATAGQVAEAKLDTAIKNVGGNAEELKPKIEETDARMRTFGYTNEQTNTALAALTTALKSPTQAMADMGVVADLARLKNIPLAQSAMLVAKAAEGQTRPLKALGIDLPVYAGGAQNVRLAQMALAKAQAAANAILAKTPGAINPASKAHASYEKALAAVRAAQTKLSSVQNSGATIMAALTARVHGQAAAFGKTLPGQIAAAKAQLDNIGEKVGNFLIPKLTMLLHVVGQVIVWFQKHTTVAKVLGGVIAGVLVTALAAYVTKLVWAGVQSVVNFAKMVAAGAVWIAQQAAGIASSIADLTVFAVEHTALAAGYIAENIAMAASATAAFIAENAATLGIVAGIALLVAGIIWLATHWSTVWNAIKTVAQDAWNNVIKPVFGFIKTVAIDPIIIEFRLLEAAWSAVWTSIKNVVSGAWNDVIKPVFNFIKTVAIGALVAEIHIMEAAWSAVWNGITSVIAGAWNNVIKPVFGFMVSEWNVIKSAAGAAWAFLRDDVFTPIKNGFNDLGSFISNAASTIGGIFSGFWNGLKSAGATVFNWVATAWNDTLGSLNFTLPSWIPGIGGDSFGFPRMPTISGYAHGGSVADGLFVAGENGPELGVKSGSSLSFLTAPQTTSMLAGLGAGGSDEKGGGQVIELHSYLQMDGETLSTQVERIQLRKGARRGQTWQQYKR